MKRQSRFSFWGGLIQVDARVAGPRATAQIGLVVDTGATFTTLAPRVAAMIGSTRIEGSPALKIRTATAVELAYQVSLDRISTLGIRASNFPVMVADLGHDLDGLLGMDFLASLNFEVRPGERRILVEMVAA